MQYSDRTCSSINEVCWRDTAWGWQVIIPTNARPPWICDVTCAGGCVNVNTASSCCKLLSGCKEDYAFGTWQQLQFCICFSHSILLLWGTILFLTWSGRGKGLPAQIGNLVTRTMELLVILWGPNWEVVIDNIIISSRWAHVVEHMLRMLYTCCISISHVGILHVLLK